MCVTTFAGIGSTTAYAASGEKADVYMVDFPRDGDANYDGVWGHSNLTLKNGWHTGRSNFTNLKAIGSYSGNVAYCIEPGISLKVGQTMNKYDENYFNNLAANGVISGDEIRLFVGRILQYGYRGTISTSWRSQNEAAANSIAQAYATQLLIWETVIGERDANFNHVAASGCSNVKDVINAKHPLRNKIFSYYNSMVQSVQNHATVPSFCNKSSGSAKTIELEWNGSKYTTTLTDSNNVLSKYNFKASISGVSFSVNGNKLTVSMDTAPSKEFTITATKKNAVRRGVVVWSEGKHGQNSSVQDVVSYAQEVSDSINGYVKMKVSYGSCQIVKTSEDGKVDGINFTITGNGINQTVTTANGGKFQIDNLMLKITNDGRKLALDQRMLNDMLPDFEGSKINACVDNIYRIWEKNTDKKSAQLVFCDLSTPKNDGTFSVYNDIRKKLIERGIPESEVKFIHEADTDMKKKELFQKTRKGEVRVLLGSTQKMGAGTNVQDIFELAAEGLTPPAIARQLTEEKVLIPSAYTLQYHPEQCNRKAEYGCTSWNANTVREILSRQEYLGHTVLRKTIGTNFKTDERRFATDEERLVFEDTHEPIVDSELWEQAHRRLKHTTRRIKEGAHQEECSPSGKAVLIRLVSGTMLLRHVNDASLQMSRCQKFWKQHISNHLSIKVRIPLQMDLQCERIFTRCLILDI